MDPKSDALTTPQFLLVLLLFAIVVYANYLVAANPLIRRYIPSFLFLRRIEKKYKQSLVKYSSFYNYLSEKDKISFEKRVQKFIDLKQFTPRGGIKEVTPEMKAMIAATAIQLTFGYPNVYFKHFKRILIYPDNYYSTITRAYHKGEVNIRGIIVLSWKSVHDGFINPSDGVNLGLHEMAHALRLINIVDNEEFNFYDKKVMTDFDQEARYEIEKIKGSSGVSSIFRDYSVTNNEEFFAGAVELFFEKPSIFKGYNPKLYGTLVNIFKIDPEDVMKANQYRWIA